MEDQLAEIRAMHKRKADAQARENGKHQGSGAGPSGVKKAAPAPAKRNNEYLNDFDVKPDIKAEGGPAVQPTRIGSPRHWTLRTPPLTSPSRQR
mgnify:FL=1